MRFRLFLGCLCLIAALATTTQSALAAFPGEDGKIAYSTFVAGSDIYSVNPDGSGQTQLTSGPQNEGSPSWSADGRRVVFQKSYYDASSIRHDEIWTMNADGSAQTFIGTGVDPGWSPDGRKILFGRIGRDSEGGGIFTVDVPGGTVTKIAPGMRDSRYPEWSPDGQLIAFNNAGLFFDGQYIYTVNPDGSNLTKLTMGGQGFDVGPTWRPDSSLLAFSYTNSYTTGSNPGVWTMSPPTEAREAH